MKYDYRNVAIKDHRLVLTQSAYSGEDQKASRPVKVAGVQSRDLSILSGTFRVNMMLEGASGGSCASFFWHNNETSETDVEIITQGTSVVNNTINWTNQPSRDTKGVPIADATVSVPISAEYSTLVDKYRTHRFDCDTKGGVSFYLDDVLVHETTRQIPDNGGSLQLKVWANGDNWWSGIPSTTDVRMHVRSIVAYYNTSSETVNHAWNLQCQKLPSHTCNAIFEPRSSPPCVRQTEHGRPSENCSDYFDEIDDNMEDSSEKEEDWNLGPGCSEAAILRHCWVWLACVVVVLILLGT